MDAENVVKISNKFEYAIRRGPHGEEVTSAIMTSHSAIVSVRTEMGARFIAGQLKAATFENVRIEFDADENEWCVFADVLEKDPRGLDRRNAAGKVTPMNDTNSAKQSRIATLAAEIRANVDQFYSDKITHEQFSAINRGLWERAENEGVADGLAYEISHDGGMSGKWGK